MQGIGGMLYSVECVQTFLVMLLNVVKHLGNVTKHSRKCCQTFQGMPSNIPRNVIRQTFWGMLPNILENTLKHAGEGSCYSAFIGTLLDYLPHALALST